MTKIHMATFLLLQLPLAWILFYIQAKCHSKLKEKVKHKGLRYLLSGIILFYLTGMYLKFNQIILLPQVNLLELVQPQAIPK